MLMFTGVFRVFSHRRKTWFRCFLDELLDREIFFMGYRLDGDMNTCPGKPITTIKGCVHAVCFFLYHYTLHRKKQWYVRDEQVALNSWGFVRICKFWIGWTQAEALCHTNITSSDARILVLVNLMCFCGICFPNFYLNTGQNFQGKLGDFQTVSMADSKKSRNSRDVCSSWIIFVDTYYLHI